MDLPDPYRDPDLVTLYDTDNPAGRDHRYYRELADALGARTVVDLGCRTALLTRALATGSRRVTGVDPSPTMLDFARRQPGSERVRWVLGDAATIPPTGDIDLVVCTGNAVQHISTDGLPAALRHVADALRPGGVLAFESRNPARRAWQEWTRPATEGERRTPFGRLREWLEVTVAEEGRVVLDAHNVIDDGEDRVYTSVLHFRTAAELTAHLLAAGFSRVQVDGDWDGGPVTDASRILVFRAVRG
ncbi:class I SAM-dependent methyltransferase [uncultured Georgenia sp.]|uniref:class I SAM-dependent methyltransferase n=1 Tax=uncultured Georgenia sp. TaxID=378209 RepID=UPI002631747A|nr:class I SAM-dependent methyltransferase [uncultured Georgenia sp.]